MNPESRTAASDLRRIELMSGTVDTLALAYYFTGQEAYAAHAARWPYEQIITLDRSDLASVLRQAAIAYREPRYEAVVATFPGIERASFQLSNPVPFGWPKDGLANERASVTNTEPSTSK